jgi:uncharacterized membrane protein
MLPNFTQFLVFVHVLAALWLAASAFGGAVVRAAGRRAPDLAGRVTALRIGWRLVTIFGLPGSILAGATGLWLVFRMPALLKMGWIHVSITLWVLILALNLFYSFPHLRRMLAAGEASLAAGAPTTELQRLAASKAPSLLADLNAVAVLIFVFLMSLKPF